MHVCCYYTVVTAQSLLHSYYTSLCIAVASFLLQNLGDKRLLNGITASISLSLSLSHHDRRIEHPAL